MWKTSPEGPPEAASRTGTDSGKARQNIDTGLTRPSGPTARVAPRGDRLPRLTHSRSDAPAGRARAGLFHLVPALLLGALGLSHAAPAQAQATPIWSATLTVKDASGSERGCATLGGSSGTECSTTSVLTDDEFSTTWSPGDEISLSIAPAGGLRLSGLSLTSALGVTGDYNYVVDLEPGFEPRVTGYTAALPHTQTHVKVMARVGAASYTLSAGKRGATAAALTSGVASAPIALAAGANVIDVKSATTEQGAPERTTTITVTRHAQDVPGAPRGLAVTAGAGAGELAVAWTASLSDPLGYDVHYTSATRIEVPDGAAASGNDPAAGWVAVSRSGTAPTQTITGLDNGTTYRVRVRAENANGKGFWEEARGTTDAVAAAVPTVRLSASPNPVAEGRTVTVTATLSAALSGGVTIPVTITDNSAEPEDHGTLASIAIGRARPAARARSRRTRTPTISTRRSRWRLARCRRR